MFGTRLVSADCATVPATAHDNPSAKDSAVTVRRCKKEACESPRPARPAGNPSDFIAKSPLRGFWDSASAPPIGLGRAREETPG